MIFRDIMINDHGMARTERDCQFAGFNVHVQNDQNAELAKPVNIRSALNDQNVVNGQ